MTRDELMKLADRVEALTGPDRGVDREIAIELGLSLPRHEPTPRYTASLDAAMTLVPEGLRIQLGEWDDEVHLRAKGSWQAILTKSGAGSSFAEMNGVGRCEHAQTAALALTAAALRSHASSLGE